MKAVQAQKVIFHAAAPMSKFIPLVMSTLSKVVGIEVDVISEQVKILTFVTEHPIITLVHGLLRTNVLSTAYVHVSPIHTT